MRGNLAEIKNSMSQMQSKLETDGQGHRGRRTYHKLEDGLVEEKVRIETWIKKIQSQECRLWEITDSMKRSNVRIIGIPEGVEKNRSRRDI